MSEQHFSFERAASFIAKEQGIEFGVEDLCIALRDGHIRGSVYVESVRHLAHPYKRMAKSDFMRWKQDEDEALLDEQDEGLSAEMYSERMKELRKLRDQGLLSATQDAVDLQALETWEMLQELNEYDTEGVWGDDNGDCLAQQSYSQFGECVWFEEEEGVPSLMPIQGALPDYLEPGYYKLLLGDGIKRFYMYLYESVKGGLSVDEAYRKYKSNYSIKVFVEREKYYAFVEDCFEEDKLGRRYKMPEPASLCIARSDLLSFINKNSMDACPGCEQLQETKEQFQSLMLEKDTLSQELKQLRAENKKLRSSPSALVFAALLCEAYLELYQKAYKSKYTQGDLTLHLSEVNPGLLGASQSSLEKLLAEGNKLLKDRRAEIDG